jgi:hypothetical protein
MAKLASLAGRRCVSVAVPVSIGTLAFLLATGSRDAALLILPLGMLFAAVGLALGSHLVIQGYLPPSNVRPLGAAALGGFAGAVCAVLGLVLGGLLANLFGLKSSEGLEWAALFLPLWICPSGGFAILSRYTVWQFVGDQIVIAVGAGAVGALVGDSLMTLLLIQPLTTGPALHAPPAMTAGFGALVAAGLAWAERKVPHGNPEAADTSSATDTTEQ